MFSKLTLATCDVLQFSCFQETSWLKAALPVLILVASWLPALNPGRTTEWRFSLFGNDPACVKTSANVNGTGPVNVEEVSHHWGAK